MGRRSQAKCVVVVEGSRVLILILRKYFLVALGIPDPLAIGESIAVSIIGVPKRHALHCVAVISVRLNEIHALILSGFLLTDHLRLGVF